jgi:hypothetical protein
LPKVNSPFDRIVLRLMLTVVETPKPLESPKRVAEPKVTAGGGAGASGKSRNGASREKGGAKEDSPPDARDLHENEEALGAASDPGNAPAGPAIAGGRRPEEAEKKEHGQDAGRGDDGSAEKYKELGDSKSDAGGTDDVDGRTRREKELDDKLSDELRKLESERKLADAEDAVVIYIEFEEPAKEGNPTAK